MATKAQLDVDRWNRVSAATERIAKLCKRLSERNGTVGMLLKDFEPRIGQFLHDFRCLCAELLFIDSGAPDGHAYFRRLEEELVTITTPDRDRRIVVDMNPQAYCISWHEAVAERIGPRLAEGLIKASGSGLSHDLGDNDWRFLGFHEDMFLKNWEALARCSIISQEKINLGLIEHELLRERILLKSVLQTKVMEPVQAQPTARGIEKPKANAKGVNGRMLAKLHEDPEAVKGWKLKDWMKFLKCSKSSVGEAPAWKDLVDSRKKQAAERAMDRHRRPRSKAKN